MSGHFIALDVAGSFRHMIGGNQTLRGASCPNCQMPLMLHLTLNTADPRLRLDWLGLRELRLVCCGRCALSWYDFSYRHISENAIELIEAFNGETVWNEWYEDVGCDVFQQRTVELKPIPPRLQEHWDKLNENEELTEAEEIEVATYINNFSGPEFGSYPIVDVINQVGGRAFLCQRLDDPPCPVCTRNGDTDARMYFLATLTNDKKQNLRFAFDDVQIIFFLCRSCGTVKVVHSSS